MECKNGKTLYCREADERVVRAFLSWQTDDKKLTVRDRVVIHMDGTAYYYLWNTQLVHRSVYGDISIYITDNSDMDDKYYGFSGRRKEVAMTQTTKNRLNAFLQYYGFNELEVHSSKKLFGVWHNGEELKNNTWYLLDRETKNLVEM